MSLRQAHSRPGPHGTDRVSELTEVHGHVSRGFEAVRRAFVENFAGRREVGGASCVYHRGEKVVDLWGGLRNERTSEPWEHDTMVVVHSATKGLAAMALALAHSRGWLDYEERVSTYWPEFAQQGKGTITVRQLLAHQAGLFALEERVDRSIVADLDRLATVLARPRPGSDKHFHRRFVNRVALLHGRENLNRAAGTFSYDARSRGVSLESLETGASQQFANLRGQRPSATVDVLVNFRKTAPPSTPRSTAAAARHLALNGRG